MNASSRYIISADSIFTEMGFLSNVAMKIQDGRIEEIGNTRPFLPDMAVLEFKGCTVAPCFCDYHLHFFERNPSRRRDCIAKLLAYGITRAYDGGAGDLGNIEVKRSNADRLSIQTAGCALYKKGTYGHSIGKAAGNMGEAEALIDRLVQAGVDFIKVIHSGMYMPDTDKISAGGFEFHELKHIVSYAKGKGLDVACHVNGEQATGEAVNTGVSSIIHGLGVSDDTLSVMAGESISFVPTVNAFASLEKITNSTNGKRNIERVVDNHLSAVKLAADKGVRVLPGSDAGASFIPYGESYYEELELFQRAGISLDRILLSAAAGSLKCGEKADFVVLDGLKVKKVFRS
jgi:imidazolonepropionase-like amidohydrolase